MNASKKPEDVTVPLCYHCHKPMQEYTRRNDEKGNLQTVGFACVCQGTMHFKNVHVGVFR